MTEKQSRKPAAGADITIGGMLKGFSSLFGEISEMLETQGEISRTGSFKLGPGRKTGVYGITVTTPGRGKPTRMDTFGMRDAGETREPVIDIIDEGEELIVIAELPGVAEETISVDLQGTDVMLRAGREGRRFERIVSLPCEAEDCSIAAFINGLLEVRLKKKGAEPDGSETE